MNKGWVWRSLCATSACCKTVVPNAAAGRSVGSAVCSASICILKWSLRMQLAMT